MAEIYNRTGEKVNILGTREGVVQPFQAPRWTDLRIGFYLSLTKPDPDDDVITGLTETMDGLPGPQLPPQDRYFIGVKDRSKILPGAPGTRFIGYSNLFIDPSIPGKSKGGSILVSSDHGIGAGTDYWRPGNTENTLINFAVTEAAHGFGFWRDGLQQHFPQNVASAGGYALLLAIRLRRNASNDQRVTIEVPTTAIHSGDIAYTSDPSKANLETALETWTVPVVTFGPVQLAAMPDSLFCYWGFHLSRLRVHNWGLVRVSQD